MNDDSINQMNSQPQEYSFRVGNITSQGVTLVDKEYNIIQLPYSLLPNGSKSGSIIKLTLMRDIEMQRKQLQQLNTLIQKLQTGSNDNIVDQNMNDSQQLTINDKNQKQQSKTKDNSKISQQEQSPIQKQQLLPNKTSMMKKKWQGSHSKQKPIIRQLSTSKNKDSIK